MKLICLLFISLFIYNNSIAQQNIGVGTVAPKAILDVASTTSGILVPRYANLADALAILPGLNATDHTGLMVFVNETANKGFWFYNGLGTFVRVGEGSPFFKLDPVAPSQIIYNDFSNFGKNFLINTSAVDYDGAGTDSKMMYLPGKNAFRAGAVSTNSWDYSNIGDYSFATGLDSKASTPYAIAMGSSVSEGIGSVALGFSNAIGNYSTASGSAVAFGLFSVALGEGNASSIHATAAGASIASGKKSTAMGQSMATADSATAFGSSNASGISSTAFGKSIASEKYSTAGGQSNAANTNATAFGLSVAFGAQSTAMGQSIANSIGATAMGVSEATGAGATAIGTGAFANGAGATALGDNVQAINDGATAFGKQSIASALGTTAAGKSTASANYATALGFSNATATYATAIGNSTAANDGAVAMNNSTANGYYSVAMGNATKTSAYFSTTMGNNTKAKSFTEVVVGNFNDTLVVADDNSFAPDSNRVFNIGIGTSNVSRKSALVVQQNGNVGVGERKPTSTLQINGSMAVNTTTRTTSNYTVVATDYTVFDNYSSVLNNTVTLPDAALFKDRIIVIKKITPSAHSITLKSNGGNVEAFAAATGYVVGSSAALSSHTLQSDGANWWIIAKF